MPGPIMNAIDAVFGRLYAIPVPDSNRTRPLQVICVGPSRSGTDSLKQALLQLGYPKVYHGFETTLPASLHCKPVLSKLIRKKYYSGSTNGDITFTAEEFDEVFGEYDAITDMPGAIFAAQLATAYPDAKIILNKRSDVDAWYRSFDATLMAHKREWWGYLCSWFCREMYWMQRCVHREMMHEFFRGDFLANGKWIYQEHCAMARGLVPADRFLEWSVEDGWEPLCQFLGKEVPKTKFPNGNTQADFMGFLVRRQGEWKRRAVQNMASTAGAVAVLATMVVLHKGVLEWLSSAWAYIGSTVQEITSSG